MARILEVAICTWNRRELLESTVQSILNAETPKNWQLRILIVNNNSTDGTQRSIEELSQNNSSIISLNESKQGHSFARNRAIENSRGDLLIWTDDDVEVSSNWLTNYVNAFEDQPAISFWGSAIVPVFPDGKPKWIDENWSAVSGCFAQRDLGDHLLELTQDRLPYGANFAIRGDVQRKFRFNTNLGRRGAMVVGDDEIELMCKLIGHGYRGMWIPQNGLRHVISVDRASEKYVWNYFVGQGIKIARREPSLPVGKLRSEIFWRRLRYYLIRPFAPSPAWFAHLACWGLAQGKLSVQLSQ